VAVLSDKTDFFNTSASEQAQKPSTRGISGCIEEFISSSRRDYLSVARLSHDSRKRPERLPPAVGPVNRFASRIKVQRAASTPW
jgi:hypothetical protein